MNNIRRWNNVVHSVEATMAVDIDPARAGYRVTLHCGRKSKIYPGSRNQYTSAMVTCLTCLVASEDS